MLCFFKISVGLSQFYILTIFCILDEVGFCISFIYYMLCLLAEEQKGMKRKKNKMFVTSNVDVLVL